MREYVGILLTLLLLNIKDGGSLEKRIPHIAIIGGGIGGASTSHFLTELFDENLEIDLYEGKTIGGRLATMEIDNNEFEAGGAIIHPRNMYMQKFVDILGLEHNIPDVMKFGIWDGNEFVYKESDWSIVSLTKLLYRYGFQVLKLQRHLNDILEDFTKIYELQDAGKSFANMTALLSAMNKEFPRLLQTSIRDYLLHLGFTERLIDELVQSTITVNYGQDVNIHSFVGFVSLAGAGVELWSVKGGNKKVPEHLIYRNKNINVIPNYVTKIRHTIDENNLSQYEVTYIDKDGTGTMMFNYDIVIIAAPLTQDQQFLIEFVDFPKKFEFPGNYHTTHVTFAKADINLKYFGLEETLECILTCNPKNTKIASISIQNPVNKSVEGDSQVLKIFSRESLDTDMMNNIVTNMTEKTATAWKAYPEYSTDMHLHNFKLHDALYHVNAIEWAASAMEMSAVGGRNVAILAYDDFIHRYNSTSNGKIQGDLHKKVHLSEEL